MMESQHFISQLLCMNPDLLTLVTVAPLGDKEFAGVEKYISPRHCYENSFKTALELDLPVIVYGAAIVYIGGERIPLEHAWVKSDDGTYFDPTYQLIDQHITFERTTEYHSLIEIPLATYISMNKETDEAECGVDFFRFRLDKDYRQYFAFAKNTSIIEVNY